MKIISNILIFFLIVSPAIGGELCFGPVKEKKGDKSNKPSFFQCFECKIQVDDGPKLTPPSKGSTPYPFNSESPIVKIWLGGKVVESFQVSKDMLEQGRDCIL